MEIVNRLPLLVRRMDALAEGPRCDATEFAALTTPAKLPAQTGVPASAPRGEIDRLIAVNAAAYRVDPALVAAIVAHESAFDSRATSPAGAAGLMQLMPATAAALGVDDPYDPQQNLRGGTRYLRELLDRFPNIELAVAAYNAGPAAVERFGGVPPYAQTRTYVRSVLETYRSQRRGTIEP